MILACEVSATAELTAAETRKAAEKKLRKAIWLVIAHPPGGSRYSTSLDAAKRRRVTPVVSLPNSLPATLEGQGFACPAFSWKSTQKPGFAAWKLCAEHWLTRTSPIITLNSGGVRHLLVVPR